MSNAEIIERSRLVSEMEQAITNARREITMAESSLIYAKKGIHGRIEVAKQRLKNATEILNEWSEK